jgi:hypothetical protein
MRVLPLLLAASCAGFAQSPVREVETGAAVVTSAPLPGLANNHLYFIDMPDHVRVFSPSGYSSIVVDLDGRGDERSYVQGIAIDSDETIAIAWGTRGGPSGIEIRDGSGTLLRTIDTGLFTPGSVAFGADHSLWSFGWQRAAKGSQVHARDYGMLRHYSAAGQEMAAFLPRSLFPKGLEPGGSQAQEQRIHVMPDRIGLVAFSGDRGDKQEWVEVDFNGNVLGRWRIDGRQFAGVTPTSDGSVYAKQTDPKTQRDIVVRLDRATSTWQPVATGAKGQLYGADGDQLIFGSWPKAVMLLDWFKQPS